MLLTDVRRSRVGELLQVAGLGKCGEGVGQSSGGKAGCSMACF